MNIFRIIAMCVLCLVYGASSKTIESSIMMTFNKTGFLKSISFVNGILSQDPNEPTDLALYFDLYGPYSGISYRIQDYKTGYSLLRVADTSALDFQAPLLITDDSVFLYDAPTYLSAGPYGMEEYFVFPLHTGIYAFCHGTLNDTTYATTKGKVSYLTRMYLACQVQDDGTTKFDSIPQYPWGTVAIRPPALRSIRSSIVPLYHVDGTPVVGNEGQTVRVRRTTK